MVVDNKHMEVPIQITSEESTVLYVYGQAWLSYILYLIKMKLTEKYIHMA